MNLPAEPLIFAQGSELKTDSHSVAKTFGKAHKNILRSIDELLKQCPEFASAHFWAYVEKRKIGIAVREVRGYTMSKDGFVLLAMGFNGKKAFELKIAYIEAFNAMRRQIDHLNTDIMHKLLAALEAEKQSFAIASLAGRILRERQTAKPVHAERINHCRAQLQPLLHGLETR